MADMYKNQYTVVVKTIGGTSVTFADSTAEGSGAAALASLEKGADIDAYAGETRTIIPFHAVDNATITLARTTVEKPEDETCQ